MTIREFCRQPGYDRALLLTWSFDAVFFERVVLQDLETGGTLVPLIVADGRQVNSAIDRWIGQVQRLGRHYVLETASTAGSFHAKLILRVGREGAVVWLGTGNVSAAGFGGNRELGTDWKVGPGEGDPGTWVPGFLNEVESWCSSDAAREVLKGLKSAPWIVARPAAASTETSVLWSLRGTSLANQLKVRWQGRRFETLYVTTGSTDESGAFLKWSHDTFGVQQAIVAVHASSAIFEASRIEGLPLKVRFIEPTKPKPLHAKCYWFDGPDGAAAVFGSANCSASAWLRPVDTDGNVEMLAVFDMVERSEWSHVLSEFDGNPLSPLEYLRERLANAETTEYPHPYRLISVELDRIESQVRVMIERNVHATARITLIVEENDPIQLTYLGHAAEPTWAGPLPEQFGSARPLFAHVRIETGSGVVETLPRWIDQTFELRRATQDRRISNALIQFGSANNYSINQNKMLDDLQRAIDFVFSGDVSFEDWTRHRAIKRQKSPDMENENRLDPERVAIGLSTRTSDEMAHGPLGSDFSLGFSGVLDLFFSALREDVRPSDETLVNEGCENEAVLKSIPAKKQSTNLTPTERSNKRLETMMASYQKRLRDPEFTRICTATQLREAISLPLALVVYGMESGWVDSGQARKWVLATVTASFHERVPECPYVGILDTVCARYDSEGRREIFDVVIGDGLLWIAVATTLYGLNWRTTGERLERSLLLRDLERRTTLRLGVTDARLDELAARHRHPDVARLAILEFPRIKQVLGQAEDWLEANFETLLGTANQETLVYQPGDLLWRPPIGWVIVEEVLTDHDRLMVKPWRSVRSGPSSELIRVKASMYVNVRCIMESNEGILKDFEALVLAAS